MRKHMISPDCTLDIEKARTPEPENVAFKSLLRLFRRVKICFYATKMVHAYNNRVNYSKHDSAWERLARLDDKACSMRVNIPSGSAIDVRSNSE